VIIALKGRTVPPRVRGRLVDGETVVIAVQNGIEHRERIGPQAHGAVVLPALANTAGRARRRPDTSSTEPETCSRSPTTRVRELRLLAPRIALRVKIESDFITAAWRKLLSNLAANPLTALRPPDGPVRRTHDPELALELLREAVVIGRAKRPPRRRRGQARTLAAYAQVPTTSGTVDAVRPPRSTARVRRPDRRRSSAPRVAMHASRLNQALLALLADSTATSTRRSSESS